MKLARAALAIVGPLVLLLTGAQEARANGRFPESNAIFFSSTQPDAIVLRTTFGILVSDDRGQTWDWVCESALGLAGVEDPMFALTPSGTSLNTSFQGVAISRDHACSFAFADGALSGRVFVDLAQRPREPTSVVVFASSYDHHDDAGVPLYRSTLFETRDEGRTFAELSSLDTALLGETVDVAAADPERLYVSALRDPGPSATAVFLTSRDHGKTFEEHPLSLVSGERSAFIAAVDPTNADRVYVRTSGPADRGSRLLVTEDAGQSFRVVLAATGQLSGFALADDAKRVFVGGPKDGLLAANTTDFAWAKKSTREIGCLKLDRNRLWACSTERSGFVVGVSTDEGATFEAKLHFCDVRGPLACEKGTRTHTECTLGAENSTRAPWPPLRTTLGCDSIPSGDAGDVPGDGGNAPALLDAGGCIVHAPAGGAVAAKFAVFVFGAAAVLRRRRRRGKQNE